MCGFVLVGGGARSGKSAFALELAMRRGTRRAFVATAEPFDDEMRERIARHAAERGARFETLEAPRALEATLARLAAERRELDVVVVDCLTLWLSNLLLDALTQEAIERRVEALVAALSAAPFETIVVTNEVGMGLVPETPLGRVFRDVAGRAHQRLARRANEVFFAVLGTVLRLRPGPVVAVDPFADPSRSGAEET
ncbi:MAG: bifunctional adenosylcobinamide kinase/adenosylcobinamide-phosphate guanylyltransferase [Polyangiales bacterium]